jgi:sterol desaturase/sphingolipid hydroxylase (fatty acid hydroxylase superfamily)
VEVLRQVREVAVGLVQQLVQPSVSVFWLYLVSALLIALAVWWVRERSGRPWWHFVKWCFPATIWRNRSVWHDMVIFAINTVLYSFLFLGPVQALSTVVSHGASARLEASFGTLSTPLGGTGWMLFMTAILVLVADLAFFITHWLQHRVPVLWEFHKVHHSAPVLQPFTVFRRHPVDIVLEGGISGVLIGSAMGVFGWASAWTLDPWTILGVNAGLFAFLLAGFNLQHSHVWLSFGRLDRVFISPATHQIHHDVSPQHHGRNLGNMFAIWDGMAGTLVRPRGRPRLVFGLGDEEEAAYRSLWSLYLWPFWRVICRLRRGSVRA